MTTRRTKTTSSPVVKLVPASIDDIEPLLFNAFMRDEELLSRLTPVKNDTLPHCVERCAMSIRDVFSSQVYADAEKRIYAVEIERRGRRRSIGYSVTIENEDAPNELYSFGINILYRKPEITQAWLAAIREKLGKFFYIALWKENSRAISFFERNKFDKFVDESEHFVTLCSNVEEFKKLQLCQ